MRPFDFRAFNKKTKRMIYLSYDNSIRFSSDGTWYISGELASDLNSELMQYTGLTDKNGIKIFEGDIVEIIFPNKSIRNSEVKWNQNYLTYYLPQIEYQWKLSEMVAFETTIEIIGNVWENPEIRL